MKAGRLLFLRVFTGWTLRVGRLFTTLIDLFRPDIPSLWRNQNDFV